jgi:hypothetical protein
VGRPLSEIGDLEISHLPTMPQPDPRQVRPPAPPQIGSQISR